MSQKRETLPYWKVQWSGQGSCARQGKSLSEDAPWLSMRGKPDKMECTVHTNNRIERLIERKTKHMSKWTHSLKMMLLNVAHWLRRYLQCLYLSVDTLPEWLEQDFRDICQRLTGRLQLEDAGQWRKLQLVLTLSCKVLGSPEIEKENFVEKTRHYYSRLTHRK